MQLLRPLLFSVSYISLCGHRFPALGSQHSSLAMSDKTPTTSGYTPGTSSVAFVTTPDETSAKKLAHSLVKNTLAACVNIVPRITSIYEWEGKINEDNECMMIVKTRTSRVEELVKFVKENHPYSVAEVITLPIQHGNELYLDWIANTVPEKK